MQGQKCQVSIFDCRTHAAEIQQYVDLVRVQYKRNANFVDIYPWETECRKDIPYIHIIAHGKINGNPIVCGWLVLLVKNDEFGKYGLILNVASRRIRDALYGGIGQLLNNSAIAWGRTNGLEFLSLWPLNEEVRALYLTPAWGYKSMRNDVRQLFHSITKEPPAELLDFMKESAAEADLNEYGFAEELAEGDEELMGMLENIDSDDETFKKQIQYIMTLDEEEQQDALREVLYTTSVMNTSGGRRSMRRTGRMKRNKKHKGTKKQKRPRKGI